MKMKNLSTIMDQILQQETMKLIKEEMENENLMGVIKKFQTLYTLSDKITDVKEFSQNGVGFIINISNVSEGELLKTCGGNSITDAQKNLMQGLHRDLKKNGFGEYCDVDVNTTGDPNLLNLSVKITVNNPEEPENMEASINETKTRKHNYSNKEEVNVDEKKEILLGDHPMCEKCGKDLNVQGSCNECGKITETKKKRTLKLTENQMIEVLNKIMSEAVDNSLVRVNSDNKRQNNDALKAVEEKIKKYLSFEGNDNPEFPNQISKGEKSARKNTDEQDQIVNDNRGRGPQDLDYDTDGIENNEPLKKFNDRLEKSLVGDTTMGNSQDGANVIKSKTGENIVKSIKTRKDSLKKEPIYPKEAVPVKVTPKTEPERTVNEEKVNTTVLSEIDRMKNMLTYNKKTQ